MVCLDYPEIATSGQLQRSRDESLTMACWEFCMRPPVRREMSGRGPVFGAELEVSDAYHACCSNQLSDPTYLIVVEWWHYIFLCCVYVSIQWWRPVCILGQIFVVHFSSV